MKIITFIGFHKELFHMKWVVGRQVSADMFGRVNNYWNFPYDSLFNNRDLHHDPEQLNTSGINVRYYLQFY